MDSIGQDMELKARWPAEAKRSRSRSHSTSNLVEDILRAVKNENLGFTDRQLLPAIEALIETYGTDDAYKWITKDNFAVLVNFILESPHKALDRCTASLRSAEKLCRKRRFDQFPVTHSDKSIELGSRLVVRDKAEQGIATASKYAYLPVNVARKKQHKERYVTDGDAIAKKRPFFKNRQDDMSHLEHRDRKILEEGNMSLSIYREADLAIPLQKRQKELCVPSDSCSTVFEEKPYNRSEKLSETRRVQEAAFSRNRSSCTDMEVPHQQMTQHLRTSKPHSNVVSSKMLTSHKTECFAGSPVKQEESGRPKSLCDEGYTVKNKKSIAHMDVKENCSSNSKIVDEENKLQSVDNSKCAIDSQMTLPDELPRSFKERSVGNGRDTEGREFSIKKGNRFVLHSGVDKSCNESVILPGNMRPIPKTKVVSDYMRNKVIARGSEEQITGKASGNYLSSFPEELKIASTGGLRTEFSADALHFSSDQKIQQCLEMKQGKAAAGNADSRENQCSLEERLPETDLWNR